MSTIVEKSSSQYVEYDEFVDYQLSNTRSEIKWTDILTTMAGIFALTLGYLFVFTLLDHWVIDGGFSQTTRGVLLASIVTVSLSWVIWKIVLPWWRQVHALFAARMIEQHVPGLKSNLLNLIDLERSGRTPNPSIMKAMQKRSAVELSKVDMEHVIDRRQLLRICYFLLAVVVLFCLYALFSPKPISFLRPLTVANVPVATQTQIVEVIPGDASVLARRSLDVRVVIRDKQPEQVLFHYTTADQSFVDEQLQMTPSTEKEGEYLLTFAGENGEGIGQPTTYFVTAGDARSETFTIAVQKVPTAVIDRVEYRYPKYMQLESRSQLIGAIDAWEGTEVVLEARIENDVPVKTASIQFLDRNRDAAGHEEIPLTVIDGNRLRGSWKLDFREDGTYAREYRIVCQSEAGLKAEDTPAYPITIRPDEAPEVAIVDPSGDLERPANAIIPLIYKARDPDFQLRYVTLRVEKEGEELQSYPLFEGEQKAVADRYRWDLKPLGLKPGEVVTFAIEARDNKQPFGNRRSTQPLKLTITAPASVDEVDEKLRQEEAEQEPQLRDEQQEAAEQNGEPGGESESENPGEEEGDNTSEEGDQDQPDSENPDGDESEEPKSTDPENNDNENQSNEENTSPAQQENSTDDSQSSDQPEPLNNDGTDDAEALEKIIQKQQEEEEENSGGASANDETGNEKTGEGGTGEEMPDDGTSEDPAQPGTGQGTPKDESSEDNAPSPENTGDTGDSTQETSPDGTGTEKRPGDPNTKGTGTPDDNPDPKPTRASDPNNIERKEGTDPSTVPSENPEGSEKPPRENTSEKPEHPPTTGTDSSKPNDPGAAKHPSGPDRPDPAEGDPDGQKSKRPDSGETGSSQQTTDGQKGETGTGDADTTDNPGDTGENPESKPGGNPADPMTEGHQKGEGEGKPGGPSSSEGKGKQPSEGGPGEGDPSPGAKPGKPGNGVPPSTGDGPPSAGGGAGSPAQGDASGTGTHELAAAEKQNLEHAQQAADLVLKRLETQLERGEVSEELLKELGWTEGQMQAFSDRLRQQLEQDRSQLTAEEQVRQRQFEEMLKNMQFEPESGKARVTDSQPDQATRSFGSRQTPVPIEYREAFEAFTRELSSEK